MVKNWRRKWQPTPVFLPENPGDGGAWWAAVYGVTQSRTRLKRLSSIIIGKAMNPFQRNSINHLTDIILKTVRSTKQGKS